MTLCIIIVHTNTVGDGVNFGKNTKKIVFVV
jgi:hypothetical protein